MRTTRTQRTAQAAWDAVSNRKRGQEASFEEYTSFAKSFPALLHTAGLCQAVAFAQARPGPHMEVLEDVIVASGLQSQVDVNQFAADARTVAVSEYIRRSRLMIGAAAWVKRYTEALGAGNA